MKKGYIKCIATVMAMALMLGSGISAFAAGPLPTHYEAAGEIMGYYQQALTFNLADMHASGFDINAYPAGTELYDISAYTAFYNSFLAADLQLDADGHEGKPEFRNEDALDGTNCNGTDCSTAYHDCVSKYSALIDTLLVSDGSNYHPGSCDSEPKKEEPKKDTEAEILQKQAEELATVMKYEEQNIALSINEELKSTNIPEVNAILTGNTREVSNIITADGFVKLCNGCPAGQALTLYDMSNKAFNKNMVQAMVNKNVPVNYIFTYNGHVYKITIPVGANVNSLFGSNTFAGPLYIGQVFGTTQIIK